MKIIISGPMHIQYRTPSGRSDEYSETVLSKLNKITSLSNKLNAPIVFSDRFSERNLDKSMIAPLCKAFFGLKNKPFIMICEKELINGVDIPVSHPLFILESAGLVNLLRPGEHSLIKGDDCHISLFNEMSQDYILKASSDIILFTQQKFSPTTDFRYIFTNKYSDNEISKDNLSILSDVGRKVPTNIDSVSVKILDTKDNILTDFILEGFDPNPFYEEEVERINSNPDINNNPISTLSKMLQNQREKETLNKNEIEESLFNVINKMKEDESVSPEAFKIIDDLWLKTKEEEPCF